MAWFADVTIYIVDRANTGMHVLELTGEPRAIAGLKP
jgi:hypothetical protein